jgi:uncharacterized protein YbjT (DUF2867 family)
VRIAIVTGASGLVGQSLVTLLAEDPDYQRVLCLNRRQLASESPKVEHHQVDFQQLTAIGPALKIGDASEIIGFCCLGTTLKQAGSRAAFAQVDFDYVSNFGQLLEALGAHHFSVISSLGASRFSPSFYARVKGKMEASVQTLAIPSIAILRPSLLLGPRRDKRPLEDWAKPLSQLMVGPLARFAGIEAFDVAKAMIALAEDRTPGAKTYSSDEISRLAAAL